MDSKKRIGIYFTSGSNWLGGVYYLINLVNSFNYLEESEKQLYTFVIFYNENSEKFIKLFDFPRLEKIKIDCQNTRLLFFKSLIIRKNLFLPEEVKKANLDGLYPFNDFPVSTNCNFKIVSWYPDLQHRFYPEYFQKFKLWQREYRLKKLLKHTHHLVLSSKDVSSHFSKFYPKISLEKIILPFVSLTNKSHFLEEDEVLQKYKIDKPYFMVSNQFYQHKDHRTILEALPQIKEDILIIMTGKMEDYRNPDYINELKNIIKEKGLKNKIQLLGVIPRNEQLSLMKYALAVIQPSLFEGWSTVVEDVKSIGGSIVVSDIEIHKEQLYPQGIYFKRKDSLDLASKLKMVIDKPNLAKVNYDYKSHIKIFAKSFAAIFTNEN